MIEFLEVIFFLVVVILLGVALSDKKSQPSSWYGTEVPFCGEERIHSPVIVFDGKGEDIMYASEEHIGIDSVESARDLEAKLALQKAIAALKADISNAIERCNSGDSVEEKELNTFYASKYKELLEMPLNTESQYENVLWLFNGGALRTDGEVYVHSGKYASNCKTRSFMAYSIPFIIGFLIPILWIAVEESDFGFGLLLGVLPGLMLGSFLALICGAIAHSVNVSDGEAANTPEAAPIIRDQKIKGRAAVLGAAAGIVSAGRSAKKTVKDIANVDGWKEMK